MTIKARNGQNKESHFVDYTILVGYIINPKCTTQIYATRTKQDTYLALNIYLKKILLKCQVQVHMTFSTQYTRTHNILSSNQLFEPCFGDLFYDGCFSQNQTGLIIFHEAGIPLLIWNATMFGIQQI